MSTPAVVPNPVPRLPGLSLPAALRVGDTLSFEVQTELPAGWLLFFVLNAIVNNAPVRILLGRDLTATPPVNGVAVDANGVGAFLGLSTGTWIAGDFDWAGFSVDPHGNRAQIASGSITLLPDLVDGAPVDSRSYNQQCLDAIRVVVKATVVDDTMMYKIGTRELTKISRKELLELEAEFEGRVRSERIRRGEIVRKRAPAVNFGGC